VRNIRDRIVAQRRSRINREGHGLGVPIPSDREIPLVSFGRDPFIICEVKRRSPSKGDIAPDLSAVAQAGRYAGSGIQSISVLTEEDNFGGSLRDLMEVKSAFPDTAVLRKDFLVDIDDIEISWKAGADAVLLIAGMLEKDTLKGMYELSRQFGMECLVEVHSKADVDKVREFQPGFVGINSRDLTTFTVDPLVPMRIAGFIDWPVQLVFESGIHSAEDAFTALDGGFKGVLVGESVVRKPQMIEDLKEAFAAAGGPFSVTESAYSAAGRAFSSVEGSSLSAGGSTPAAFETDKKTQFWREIAARITSREGATGSEKQPDKRAAKALEKPLVKICGITNPEDAEMAVRLGADIIGFVFAESPRRAEIGLPATLRGLDVLKVGVVVGGSQGLDEGLHQDLKRMLRSGDLDAVQFHGDEPAESCFEWAYPYYKAVRIREKTDAAAAEKYRCPRVLFDAFSKEAYGGTGVSIPDEILTGIRDKPVWLAGGLGPDNIRNVIARYRPELVDASSRLESRPGKKDPVKMEQFFQEIDNG